eukprot:6182141-Pleurochrysis_carterae.AAC.2
MLRREFLLRAFSVPHCGIVCPTAPVQTISTERAHREKAVGDMNRDAPQSLTCFRGTMGSSTLLLPCPSELGAFAC